MPSQRFKKQSHTVHVSTCHCNGLGKSSRLWAPHTSYLRLGSSERDRLMSYRALFKAHMDDALLADIRESIQKGLALGNDRFKDQVHALTGRRVTPRKRGPEKRTSGI